MGDAFFQPAAKVKEFLAYELLRKIQISEYLLQVSEYSGKKYDYI